MATAHGQRSRKLVAGRAPLSLETAMANTHRHRRCLAGFAQREPDTVQGLPLVVDADADVLLSVEVACPEGCDLSGQTVSIRDPVGSELACAGLSQDTGGRHRTEWITVRAPRDVGEHRYTAVLAEHAAPEGTVHEEVTSELPLIVKAHTLHLNAWGWPSAVAAGERFNLKVSAKCSSACKLGGRPFRITDQHGEALASGVLRDETWPGTVGLYFAEVEVAAPPGTGVHSWKLEFAESVSGTPHQRASCSITPRIVDPPDWVVSVEVFDRVKHSPIEGVHVLAHPYRAVTDTGGVARLKVSGGSYTLRVSGLMYTAYQSVIDVRGDVTVRVELSEPEEPEELLRFY